jgi:hypothetical protein
MADFPSHFNPAATPLQRCCGVGIAGTDPRPGVAGQGHECVESAPAKEKCAKKRLQSELDTIISLLVIESFIDMIKAVCPKRFGD